MSNTYSDQQQVHTFEWEPQPETTTPAPASVQEWKEPPTVTTKTTYEQTVVESMTDTPTINLREIAERKAAARDIAAAARRERANPTGANPSAVIEWQAPPPGWKWVADRSGAEHLVPITEPQAALKAAPNIVYVPPKMK